METILANVAVWGLGLALLNLIITVDRVIHDPERSQPIKVAVIIVAAILISYALGIGVFALQLMLAGGTGAMPEMPPPTG